MFQEVSMRIFKYKLTNSNFKKFKIKLTNLKDRLLSLLEKSKGKKINLKILKIISKELSKH
jgi:hypothetical protein